MHYILLLFALILVSCDKGPTEPVITEPTVDAISGWQNAGLQMSGDSCGIVNIYHHENTSQLICNNTKGELFIGDTKNENWEKVPISNTDQRIYEMSMSGDTLFLVTMWENLWAFDIPSRTWINKTPPEGTWHDVRNYRKLWCPIKSKDGNLYLHFSVYHRDSLGNVVTKYDSGTKIFRLTTSNQWEAVHEGFPEISGTGFEFQEIENTLYLLSYENGLWRFDGAKTWERVPGTVPYEDLPGTPCPKPRSITTHNGNIYVGTIGGRVLKLNPDDTWEELKYALRGSTMETMDTLPQVYGGAYFLQSFNGILYHTHGQVYRSEIDSLWKPITPNSKDTVYLQDHYDKVTTWLYAKCMRQVVIGDTIYNALTDASGKEHGVYRLDLNQCGWYRDYKKTGILK